MLKLREPIKLTIRSDLLQSGDNFCERIRGNYSYMGSELDETDLLHLTTQPPEVYLMGGGMSSLISNANIENTQIQKVSIINNLINRILISADAKLSYQDIVYISNVLHKLGIKDERKFMKEVRRLTQETKQLSDTTELYWNNTEELRNMVSEYAGDLRSEFKSETEILNANVLHLHESVNRRLKTAAIYQIMRNYYENTESIRNISNAEFRISEQGRFAKEVLLSRLRETVRQEVQPLIYRHDNIYEGDETEINSMSLEQINERVSSAVLMNLIDNLYEISYERIDHHIRNWMTTQDSYYGAADNVLYRLEQNTAYLQYLHEQYVANIEKGDTYESETAFIKQLLELRQNIDNSLRQTAQYYDSENRIYTDQRFISSSRTDIEGDSFVSADITHISNVSEGDETLFSENNRRDGDTLINRDESKHESRADISSVTNIEGAQIQAPAPGSPAELTHITREGDVDESTQNIDNSAQIRQELYQTYQQNVARNRRYMQNLKNIIENNAPQQSGETPTQMTQRAAAMALENQEQVIEQFLHSEERETQRLETIRQESEKLLHPLQQRAHELIREYIREPQRFYMSEQISRDNLGLLIYDIRQAMEAEEKAGAEQGAQGEGYTPASEGSHTGPYAYPASSDSRPVTGAYPVSTSYIPEAAMERVYESLSLQNIFPVFNMTEIKEGDVSIESVAGSVREHARALSEAAKDTEASRELLENIYREDERTEREFSSYITQREEHSEREVLIRHQNDTVSRLLEHVVNRWARRQLNDAAPHNIFDEESISFVHKNTETTVDEETIEDLRQEMLRMEETQRSIEQHTQNRVSEETTVVNNINSRTVEQNKEEIINVVNNSMRAQLDVITERVYGRIERQLKNVQRRRGL